jgi:hypothetical protein
MNEDFVTGLGGGTGTLYYQGQTYPFKLAGTVVGPGGGVAKITHLARSTSSPVSLIFPAGTQSAGAAGFSTSGASDLWL